MYNICSNCFKTLNVCFKKPKSRSGIDSSVFKCDFNDFDDDVEEDGNESYRIQNTSMVLEKELMTGLEQPLSCRNLNSRAFSSMLMSRESDELVGYKSPVNDVISCFEKYNSNHVEKGGIRESGMHFQTVYSTFRRLNISSAQVQSQPHQQIQAPIISPCGRPITNYWKARRKEKDSTSASSTASVGSSGCSSGGSGGHEEGKLYLESALLERHLNETELKGLVSMPSGLEENEWMASHTIALFEHINLIYGTISEFCTSTSCPDMTGPCMRTYLWFDEKGKKVKVAAPQYIDYVMTFIQKTIDDESIFPTKSTNAFPSSFKPIVKKIFRLMFHVIAHIYHCHFKEIVLLSLHAHLNCVFAHFTIFNEKFKLVEEKETDILQDLSLAMNLRCSGSNGGVEDDPMCESNKENIIISNKITMGHHHSGCSSGDPNSGDVSLASSNPASSGCNATSGEESLIIKEPALVNASSESQ